MGLIILSRLACVYVVGLYIYIYIYIYIYSSKYKCVYSQSCCDIRISDSVSPCYVRCSSQAAHLEN